MNKQIFMMMGLMPLAATHVNAQEYIYGAYINLQRMVRSEQYN